MSLSMSCSMSLLDSMSFGMDTELQQPQQQPQLPSDETHQFFEALYSGLMTVDKLLEILKQFRSSSVQKEKVLLRHLNYVPCPEVL